MPYIQLPRSGSSNNQSSNDQNIALNKNKNQSTNRAGNKKPSNKCLQNNLIYSMYLPMCFKDENQIIKSQNHFGQYGDIETIIYAASTSPKDDCQQPDHIQAYITFNNQKEAAIAIVVIICFIKAVNQIPYDSKVIRATYGTNRMCNSFYTGQKCTVRNCFYLHDQRKSINIQGPLKTDFAKQKIIAQQIVKKNLTFFISKIEQLKQEKPQSDSKNKKTQFIRFPSIQQVIKDLIDKNIISKATYRDAHQQYLSTKKKMSDSVKKIQYIRYKKKPEPIVQQQTKENSISLLPLQNKKTYIKDNLNEKSSLPQQKKQLKNQFLMSQIIKSLDQLHSNKSKKTVYIQKPLGLKEFQIVGKSQETIQIYWQFLDQKDDCKSDQMETQESQTQAQHLQAFPILGIQSTKESTRKYSSPQFPTDDFKVLSRLKQEITKNPLIKKSRLDFVESVSVLQKKIQFDKITLLLKGSLIK